MYHNSNNNVYEQCRSVNNFLILDLKEEEKEEEVVSCGQSSTLNLPLLDSGTLAGGSNVLYNTKLFQEIHLSKINYKRFNLLIYSMNATHSTMQLFELCHKSSTIR